MRRTVTTIAGSVAIAMLSASVALAGGGVSGTAKGHGQAVSEVAKAVEATSEATHGEQVSAIAKLHGAVVSAAAKAQGAANAAAGKAKGQAASEARGANAGAAAEPGGLKDARS